MNRLYVASLLVMLAVGCISKPEPWSPDGGDKDLGDTEVSTVDGKADLSITDWQVSDLAPEDALLDISATDLKEVADGKIQDALDLLADADVEACAPVCKGGGVVSSPNLGVWQSTYQTNGVDCGCSGVVTDCHAIYVGKVVSTSGNSASLRFSKVGGGLPGGKVEYWVVDVPTVQMDCNKLGDYEVRSAGTWDPSDGELAAQVSLWDSNVDFAEAQVGEVKRLGLITSSSDDTTKNWFTKFPLEFEKSEVIPFDCGPDGCSGLCGFCGMQQECQDNICICMFNMCGEQCCEWKQVCCEDEDACPAGCCDEECAGKQCGENGCGGSCGECTDGETCQEGLCACSEGGCGEHDVWQILDPGKQCGEDEVPVCIKLLEAKDKLGKATMTAVVSKLDGSVFEDTVFVRFNNKSNGNFADPANSCQPEGMSELEYEVDIEDLDVDGVAPIFASVWLPCLEGDKFETGAASLFHGPKMAVCCGAGQVCDGDVCCTQDCEGKECGDDGCGGVCGTCNDTLACTVDSCDAGACQFTPDDACLIAGVCHDSGDKGADTCLECVPGTSTDEWTKLEDGISCGNNAECLDSVCSCINEKCGETCCDVGQVCEGDACCTPDCDGKECGDDGCGSGCGNCTDNLECTVDTCGNGTCLFTPGNACVIGDECIDAEVKGSDFCVECMPGTSTSAWSPLQDGTTCDNNAECQTGTCSCIAEKCVEECCDVGAVCFWEACCVPQCDGKECGDNGCGDSCGECEDKLTCTDDSCGEDGTCDFEINNFHCVLENTCLSSGTKEPGNKCRECEPTKDKLAWSNIENGTSCGNNAECLDGTCTCVNETCVETCCDAGQVCNEGACCAPQCDGKECGDDGCGGSCGECTGPQEECVVGQCQCQPACDNKQCGDDGCGGDCGICDDDNDCTEDTCVPESGLCESQNLADGTVCISDGLCNPICADGTCTDNTQLEECDGIDNNCKKAIDEGELCDDNVQCTQDICEGDKGCSHVPQDEGCDDDNPCTVDLCVPGVGCNNEPGNVGMCGDSDICHAGACVSLASVGGLISAGFHSSCAVKADGTLVCWGDNEYGQLGNGTLTPSPSPVAVWGLSGVVSVASGQLFSCAATSSGEAYCWGQGGSLGNGQSEQVSVPVEVVGPSDVAEVVAGDFYACARTSSGEVWCWGSNPFGELGNGNFGGHNLDPNKVNVIGTSTPLSGVVAIAAAGHGGHTCVVKADGTVWCWGYNGQSQLGDSSKENKNHPTLVSGISSAIDVVAGHFHTCVLVDDGSVWCFGQNNVGQLGDGTGEDKNVPVQISTLEDVISLVPGRTHTCAITSEMKTLCWGRNYPYLVAGEPDKLLSPVEVVEAADTVSGAGWETHYCVLMGDGSARCWGDNTFGELGDGTGGNRNTPTKVVNIEGAKAVDTQSALSCAIDGSDKVWCWGGDWLGTGVKQDSPVPLEVQGVADIGLVAVGSQHACAAGFDSGVWCWGYNSSGQLGNGTGEDGFAPVAVPGLTSIKPVSMSAYSHTCLVDDDGEGLCWGPNSDGETTGDMNPTVPHVAVPYLVGLSAVATGVNHSCGLVSDGSIWCWGGNSHGQLGNGETGGENKFVEVTELQSASHIAAGAHHSCVVVVEDGSVWCWGNNNHGQLGNGSTENSNSPAKVKNINGATAVVAGNYFSCALVGQGVVRCWGHNIYGQLGDGSFSDRIMPVAVKNLDNIVGLAAGGNNTCAIDGEGAVWCWGWASQGQLGDGNAWKTTPTQVVDYP
jgi:alpha-tubulin suppressor-like RCC1 family protein